MKIKNSELNVVDNCLSNLVTTKELTAEHILDIIKVKKISSEGSKDYNEAKLEVFKAHKMTSDNGQLKEGFEKMSDYSKVEKKIKEIGEAEVDLKPVNFLTMEEIKPSLDAVGANMSMIEVIVKYLVKK